LLPVDGGEVEQALQRPTADGAEQIAHVAMGLERPGARALWRSEVGGRERAPTQSHRLMAPIATRLHAARAKRSKP
jgi:hypothetical protein